VAQATLAWATARQTDGVYACLLVLAV
jgi:hypothetical protein